MITFREHIREDIPFRVQWFSRAEVAKSLAGTEPYQTSLEKETEWFERYEKSPDKAFYTILSDNLPVGLVGLTNITDESAELFIVVGEPDSWGKGIGSEALKYIEKVAKERGIRKLKLSVAEENKRAVNLYLKNSFIKVNTENGEVTMEKDL